MITRVQHSGPSGRARNLEERLTVRFPGGYRVVAALVQRRVSPRSRLRRLVLRRLQVSAYAAFSRRDYELMLIRYDRDAELEFEPDFAPLGLSGKHRGHDGMLTMIATLDEGWTDPEIVPAMVLDMGDRGVGLGHLRVRGAASGIELESEFAQLLEFRRGLVARERAFLSWKKGLRAAGLDPEAIALPPG